MILSKKYNKSDFSDWFILQIHFEYEKVQYFDLLDRCMEMHLQKILKLNI